MKKYIMMALLLWYCIGAWADNNITLSNVQGAAGTEVTVSVSMTNTDAVSALQLSIPLDDNLTFVENSQQAGGRIIGHTLSAGVKDGVLNVMVYSSTMATISGNEGEVCSFKLLLGYNPGTINLTPSKTALTGSDGTSLTATTTAGNVEIQGAKIQIRNNTLNFGKTGINESSTQYFSFENVGNETLTITDITFSSTIFSISEELPKTINANSSGYLYVYCKPTARGNIDEEMTIVSNSVTGNSTIRLTATPYGVNELRLGNASGSTDEEVTIPVSLKNYDDISGLQMEIKLPKELEYVDGSFVLSDRKQDHVCSASLTDDVLTIVAYSPNDKPFTGSDGEIGSFKVKIVGSNNVYLNIDNAMLSSVIDGKTIDVLSAKNGCTVSVKSPNMYANSSLDFGRISINEQDAQKSFNIRNWGSAPLVISNIAFANGKFSIKEGLPITIEASSNKDITIVCDTKEEGDINTQMEIYTNDPNKRLFIVNITGEIYTPDYLTAVVGAKPDEVNLDISLNNYSNIYGIQFDIVTTQDFTASADDVTLAERGQKLSVSINSIGEGKLRVVAYVKDNQFISTGEGKVMTIKMVPKESLGNGEHNMTLSNITLGSKGMKNIYAGKDVNINFGIGDPVTITAKSYTRTYGDANPVFEFTAEGATLTGTPEITCAATATSPVGTYPIVIKKGTVTNYNDTYVNGTLTITKAPLNVKAGTYTKKRNEENPEFTLTYEGFKNNETEAVFITKPTATTTATKESEPGEYPVTVSGGEAENYELSYTNGTLIVNEVDPVTVTAKSYSRVYGEANPTFEYTSEGATLVGVPEITCEATATSPVGTYPIVIKKGTVTNYNDTYVNGTLTITKAPLSVKAGTYTRKQGEDNPEFTLSYEGFKNNETEAVLTKKPTATTTATKGSVPGEYEVTVSGGEATNYEFAYTNGKLIVTDADAVVVTAKSYTRTYGDANPTFEFTSSGATLVGVPEITCEATATSPVGTYPIVIKKGTVTNYNDTYVNGTLTITKAPLSVKAGTYTRKQGEDNPEFTLSYEGFKNNETEDVLTKKPTATTTATKGSVPGEYEVTVSGGEATNYEFAYTNGKLIVTDADAVVVTAKSYTRTYGDANPTFEFTSSGATLVGVPEITCEATATSPVGTYPIVIKKGTVTNYNDTYVNGTLTITKAPLTVKVENVTREQYVENPEFVITYSGWKVGDDESVLTKKPTATTTATKDSPVGEYAIVVSGGETQNYEFSYQNGVLTVTESTGIYEISVTHPADVYNMQGNKVRTKATTLEGLPQGVYIVNGRKVLIK